MEEFESKENIIENNTNNKDIKSKKKTNVILYTIFMIIFFFLITSFGIWGFISSYLLDCINNYPNGSMVVSEAVLAVLVLIIMLLFKNKYVFTQKRESLKTGLFYGLFYILFALLFFIFFSHTALNYLSASVNILLFSLLIGIAEEFLCRGWLLNEFLERFGNTKKGIWYSIIVSGIIFGTIHFGNILTGQSIADTVIQVLSAAGTGIVFGVIYYKTKNIWSVVILHAIWDFSLMLNYVVPVVSMQATTTSLTTISIVFSILLVFAELLCIIPYIRNIDDKPKKKSIIIISIVALILYFISLIISNYFSTNFGKEYEYEDFTIENYSVKYNYFSDFYIKSNNDKEKYDFKLSINKNDKLILSNEIINKSIELESTSITEYTIYENDNDYVIAYIDFIDSSNVFLKYVYVNKNKLSNDESFLNSIKNNFTEYLLPDDLLFVEIEDYDKKISYLGLYNIDYGYYLLNNNKVMILNREK